MRTLAAQKVFSTGEKTYLWADVVLAAKLCGEWMKLEEDLREGIACMKRAEANHNGPSPVEVNAAARAFRLERDLISAEETELWLEGWGLSVGDWKGYLGRSLARERWSSDVRAIESQQVTDEEVGALIKSEAVCSGQLAHFARKLAARAAIHARTEEEAEAARDRDSSEATPEPTPQVPPTGTCQSPGIDPDSCTAIGVLRNLEQSFANFSKKLRTVRAIEDHVRSHYLAWIRLRCLYVSFPDEDMAQEAALCVREDGMRLEAVVSGTEANLYEASFYLEQLESELSSQLVGARKGEFLGPLSFGGAPTLFLVLDKIMPSTDDPELRDMAQQSLLQSAVELEVAARVRWHTRL